MKPPLSPVMAGLVPAIHACSRGAGVIFGVMPVPGLDPGIDPGIHTAPAASGAASWIAGSSPAMTNETASPAGGRGVIFGVMPGLDPGIHAAIATSGTAVWIAGSSPAMTSEIAEPVREAAESPIPIRYSPLAIRYLVTA